MSGFDVVVLTERVEHHEEVHADYSEDCITIQIALGWMHSRVYTDIHHGKSLPGGANDQRPFATQLLSEGHQSDSSDDDLDNSVYAGCEQT